MPRECAARRSRPRRNPAGAGGFFVWGYAEVSYPVSSSPSLPQFLISSSLSLALFSSLCTRFRGVQYGHGWRAGFHIIFMVSLYIHGFTSYSWFQFIFMVSVYFHGLTLYSWFHAVFTTSRNTHPGRRCREKIQRGRPRPLRNPAGAGGRRVAPTFFV